MTSLIANRLTRQDIGSPVPIGLSHIAEAMEATSEHPSRAASRVMAAAPYSTRPPSPPYIHVPSIGIQDANYLTIVPSFGNIDSTLLTKDDLDIITGGKSQIAFDKTCEWQYEGRRTAQPILDFLYLGPAQVVRDEEFLRSKGITMVLAIFDSRMAVNFTVIEKRTAPLGIAAEKVLIDSRFDLVGKFKTTIKIINDHLLDVYRAQAVQVGEGEHNGKMAIDKGKFKRGKVLVCCETGNERSAGICAAYLMAVFGVGHIEAMQFVGLQRFCANFDDDLKNAMRTYDEIVSANRDVSRSGTVSQPKRHIEDTMDISDDEKASEMDDERYVSRGFTPFVDRPF